MIESIEEIANKIKAARKKKGLSQRALGAKVGIPQSHLSKIERGMVDLQTSSLIQLARILEMELMLVSRSHVSAVQALEKRGSLKSVPVYQLPDEETEDENA